MKKLDDVAAKIPKLFPNVSVTSVKVTKGNNWLQQVCLHSIYFIYSFYLLILLNFIFID